MAGTFFSTWALWQKMTFILGCAVVFTLCLGFSKLLYNRHRLRKYEMLAVMATASPEKAAQIPLTEDVESNAMTKIPFGIRAIQSGIEIDGIWVSQPSTPTSNMSRESLFASMPRPQLPSSLSEPALLHPNSAESSIRSSTMSSTASRSFSSDGTASMRQFGGSSASSLHSAAPKQDSRRFNAERSLPQALVETTTPRGVNTTPRYGDPLKAGYPRSRHNDRGRIPSESSHDLNHRPRQDVTPRARVSESPHAQAVITNEVHQNRHEESSCGMEDDGDLGMLDRHRLSHVASTGQLTPRTSPHSRESQRPDGTSSLKMKEDYNYQPLQAMISAKHVNGKPFWHIPDGLTMDSSTPLERQTKTSKNVGVGQELKDGDSVAEACSQDSSAGLKRPDVFRRVNSGFEIVRPGSMKKLEPAKFDDEEGQSLAKNRFSVRSLPRMLQKKQRYDSLNI